ncbi:hypothetical protein WG947_14220 [Pontibacter sp. H259]|uniref:hypothetical protein n=1 Tax=Pontibacter sp. H259 TaxID=3133421 RepID=UPI0030BF446B
MKLNLTSKVLGMFVVAALTLTACGDKDDDAQPNVGQTACKLTEVEDDDDVTVAEYNANGYITNMTSTELDGEEENVYLTAFTYDNTNKLIKEEYFWNGEADGYTTYEYANNMISKAKSYYDGELQYTATLAYDANKRLTSVTEVENGSTEQYSLHFTYNSAGNVSQTDTKYMGETFMTTKYENYDNKLTPLAAVKGMVDVYSGTGRNNPGKETTTYYWSEEPETYVTTYTYQYNSNNLPTKTTETTEDGTSVSNFTYQCN